MSRKYEIDVKKEWGTQSFYNFYFLQLLPKIIQRLLCVLHFPFKNMQQTFMTCTLKILWFKIAWFLRVKLTLLPKATFSHYELTGEQILIYFSNRILNSSKSRK